MQLILCYHSLDSLDSKGISLNYFKYQIFSLKWFLKVWNFTFKKEFELIVTFDDGYANNIPAIKWLSSKNIRTIYAISTDYVDSDILFFWDSCNIIFSIPKALNSLQDIYADSSDMDTFIKRVSEFSTIDRRSFSIVANKIAKKYSPSYEKSKNALRPISSHELIELSKIEQVQIASHTSSHGSLGRMQQLNKELNKELVDSFIYLEKLLKRKLNLFVYPFGSREDLLNDSEFLFKDLSTIKTFTTEKKLNLDLSNERNIPRVVIGSKSILRFYIEILRACRRSFVSS